MRHSRVSATAGEARKSGSGAAKASRPDQSGAAAASHRPVTVDKDVDELNRAFPRSRVNWSKFRWYHTFWLLYVPVGLVVVAVRFIMLLGYFAVLRYVLPRNARSLWFWTTWGVSCFYKTRHVKDDRHRELYQASDFVYATPHQVKDMLTQNGAKSQEEVSKTIFAMEHHGWFLDATLFHCLMLRNGVGSTTLVGRGAATDSFVSLLLPKAYAMLMGPGEKLADILARWRSRKAGGRVEPFVLFPQGTTCAVDTVCDFQPRVVELLQREEKIRPVAVDVISPLPFIELRGLGATNTADLVWYTFTPWWMVVFTILPELPGRLTADPPAAAAYMQRATAGAGVAPKSICRVDLFDKRSWEKRAMARQVPDYRRTEFGLIARLQSSWPERLRWLPVFLHYATLEPILLGLSAAAALLSLGPGASIVFGTLGRAVSLNLCLLHLGKLYTRVPRPSWVFGRRLPLRPADLKRPVQSKDYAFPSGHSGFVSCVWAVATAVALANGAAAAGAAAASAPPFVGPQALRRFVLSAAGGAAGPLGLPLWAHCALGAFALTAALARVYLALHWPTDVAGGLLLGGLNGALVGAVLDPWFLSLSPSAQLRAVALGASTFAFVCKFVLAAPSGADRAAFEAWSNVAGTRVDPLDPHLWQVAAGILGGVWGAAPLAAALGELSAARAAAAVSAAAATAASPALLLAARVAGAGAGAALVAAGVAALLVVPHKLLSRRATAGRLAGKTSGKVAGRWTSVEIFEQLHLIVGLVLLLQVLLVATSLVAPTVEAMVLGGGFSSSSFLGNLFGSVFFYTPVA